MNDLDNKIKAALEGSDSFSLEIDESHLTDDLIGAFRGRNRWWNAFAFCLSFTFFVLSVWCVFRFFGTDVLKMQLFWGFAFMACSVWVGLTKTYFWMEIQTNRILREVKRVELLILQKNQGK